MLTRNENGKLSRGIETISKNRMWILQLKTSNLKFNTLGRLTGEKRWHRNKLVNFNIDCLIWGTMKKNTILEACGTMLKRYSIRVIENIEGEGRKN